MSPISDSKAYIFRLFASFTATYNPVSAPAALTDEHPRPHFRTDNNSSDTLTFPDGRKLGYAQYGLLTGRPIFYLHGLPGSRLEAAGFDELGLELGACVIAVDRPGIGWSSPHPGRTLLDHPKDLELLATHLELDHYSVLGTSGGGPYALACAAALPQEKLECVSIVCGLGPPDIGFGFRIEDIRPKLPVQLWYGKFDTFIPLNHGVQIAARLGGRAYLRLEDETHASIVVNQMREILEQLVRST